MSALHRGRAPPGKPCAAVVVRGKLGCLGRMLTDQIQAVARKDARTLPQTALFSFKLRLNKPQRTLHDLVKAYANIVVSLRVQMQLCRLPCDAQLLIERLGKTCRHNLVIPAVMQLQRTGQVSQKTARKCGRPNTSFAHIVGHCFTLDFKY